MGLQDMETWFHHGDMIMSIQLIEIGLLMTGQFHHTCQILILTDSQDAPNKSVHTHRSPPEADQYHASYEHYNGLQPGH